MDVGCVPIFRDNISAINIAKIPIQYKRIKYIVIRHNFLRYIVENGNISIMFCCIKEKISNIFSKEPSREHYEKNWLNGMIKIA